jgi:cobalamin biosynthesis protein CbiG
VGEVVVGVGLRPGAEIGQILEAVRIVLGSSVIRCLATVDRRAREPGLLAAAASLSVPIVFFTPAQLAAIEVPNPAIRTATALGTASVAEAAALAEAGRTGIGRLVVAKTTVAGVTVAVGE